MFLSSLNLENYRSYKKKTFSFSKEITVVVGENTVGKTNLLEAIYLLATGKSFRAEKEAEAINWSSDFAKIKAQILTENLPYEEKVTKELEVIIVNQVKLGQGPVRLDSGQKNDGKSLKSKKYLINKVAKRQIDFLGNLYAVMFSPTDLELISSSPSLRRRYLDLVLVQLAKAYRRSLHLYEKGLRQRNKLLERIRDEGVSSGQLLFWNDLLVKNGSYLNNLRREFINFLNHLPKQGSQFSIYYDQSEISEARLKQYAQEEILAATTLVGPHRDDFRIFLEKENQSAHKIDINLYASRGEQRMGVLWLKIGELEFLKEKTGSIPILLLDDIFSELDENHREEVLHMVSRGQTIITTTDLSRLDKPVLEKMQVIKLS